MATWKGISQRNGQLSDRSQWLQGVVKIGYLKTSCIYMAKNWMEEIFIIGKCISVATEVNKVLLMRQYVSLLKMTAFLLAFENWCDLFVNLKTYTSHHCLLNIFPSALAIFINYYRRRGAPFGGFIGKTCKTFGPLGRFKAQAKWMIQICAQCGVAWCVVVVHRRHRWCSCSCSCRGARHLIARRHRQVRQEIIVGQGSGRVLRNLWQLRAASHDASTQCVCIPLN